MAKATRGRGKRGPNTASRFALPYAGLSPDVALDALESLGLRADGRLLALNSFENRVYQMGIEDAPTVIVKFYRPERWSDAQILEEHAFAQELLQREIPVAAPMVIRETTLHRWKEFRFTVFPRKAGRAPELENPDTLEWMGRFMGRIHAVGALRPFRVRASITIDSFGRDSRNWLLDRHFIPEDLLLSWQSTVDQALERVEQCYERAGAIKLIRLHGDCHAGNVLWAEEGEQRGPCFVDFDDCVNGPAIQDLWMLLPAGRGDMTRALSDLLAGYEEFHEFDRRELHLIEALRTLRLIHYSAWLARRWDDPAFPAAFPWFNTQHYWQDRILELREQIALMDEPPIGPV